MRRWFLVPAILFLGVGLVNGGADLPSAWGLLLLGVPLALLLLQFFRPTKVGWRLGFGSFCLLILATAALDLSVAVPRGLPPLSASAAMVALFAVQFGVLAWMLWLAKPRDSQTRGIMPGPLLKRVVQSSTGQGTSANSKRVGVPPNNPLQATAGVECVLVSSGAFARGA